MDTIDNSNRIKEEQKYADKVVSKIDELIAKQEKISEKDLNEAREMGKYHWENLSQMDFIERASGEYQIDRHATITNEGLEKLRRLNKARPKPFFGKIVYEMDGEKEECYIGIMPIMDDLNLDFYVYDWRSAIGSLFYNKKIGKTSLETPAGKEDCTLEERAQIKIEDCKVKRVIDTELHISDDQLQEVLSRSSSDKMKSIVSTIQEEQNDIIRNLNDKKIIVQGCAGSGKTSVALHRLSYLLYNDHKSKSENMLIFSPSDAFSSYISNVLPEMGEENVLQTTFSDFANSFVKKFDRLESYTEFVSKYYDGLNSESKNKLNKFKFSLEYKDALDKFIRRKSNAYRFQDDFSYNNLTIPMDYLNRILVSLNSSSLLEKIDILSDEVYKLYKRGECINKQVLKSRIAKALIKPAFDSKALYNEFLQSEEFENAFGSKCEKVDKKLLEYPDLIGLLYLNFEMIGYPKNTLINYLVIDEAQDYAPLQMEMIAKMFNGASITALGDANQTINPYFKYDSLEEMKKTLGNSARYIKLNKAYRSSPEIMEYTNEVIDDKDIESIRNSTNNPVEIKEVTKENLFKQLVEDILRLRQNGLNRICVITKNSQEAKAIYEGLKDDIDNLTVLNTDSNLESNSVISPSYLAKGLEFDAVISYNDKDNPYREEDKYLYYVACTRAQHNLVVYNNPKSLKMKRC